MIRAALEIDSEASFWDCFLELRKEARNDSMELCINLAELRGIMRYITTLLFGHHSRMSRRHIYAVGDKQASRLYDVKQSHRDSDESCNQ